MKKTKLITVLSLSLILVLLLSTVCFAANLKNGSKGTEVKQLQMNLNGLGYDCGSADGAFGKNTEKAVKAFQKAAGLEADGIAGSKTLSAIKKIAKEVQNDLKALGYDPGSVDGIIGSNTVKALKKFQKDHGYSQTGVATDDVRDDLKDALKEMKANAAEKKAAEEAKKKAEAEKKAAEEAKKKAEAEKKAAEEAKKQAEAEKKAAEEAKKQAEAEKKAKEEAKKQAAEKEAKAKAEAEKKAAEKEAKAKAEAEKKAAEESKKKAEAEKRSEAAKNEVEAEIASFNKTAKDVNSWYVLDTKANPNGAPLRSSPFNNGINNTVGGLTANSSAVYVVSEGTNTKGNLWYKLKDGKYIFSENVKELDNYVITYDANKGTGAPDNDKAYKGISFVISSKEPERKDHRFIGWATSKTATTAQYKKADLTTFNKNTALYAVWEEITTTLKIGSGKYDPKTLNVGGKYSISGKITSDYNITSVTVGVYNTNGSKTSVIQTARPNAKSYDIKSLDSKLKFGNLAAGDYRFKVIAIDSSNSAEIVLVDKALKVTRPGLEGSPVSITKAQKDYLSNLGGCRQHYDAKGGGYTTDKNKKDPDGNGLCTSCAGLTMIWRKEYLITGQGPTVTFNEFREAGGWSATRNRTGGTPARVYDFEKIPAGSLKGSLKEKTDYLKALLDRHPEGIFLYCDYYKKSDGKWKASTHVVVLTRYEGDQFYAIDPVNITEKKFEDTYLTKGYISENGFKGSKIESALSKVIHLSYIKDVKLK